MTSSILMGSLAVLVAVVACTAGLLLRVPALLPEDRLVPRGGGAASILYWGTWAALALTAALVCVSVIA